MNYLGDFATGATVYVPFHTFNSSGASVTLTGLAVTDIEIYKDGSATQRASDAGYTLLDTDGIDFDGITGIHGFKVDLSDNTDSGFYAAGHDYFIVISAVTVDSQTVNFVAASFSIQNRYTGGVALDAAGVRSAVGLTSANLDTQLSTIDDFLDTEVAAIKAKTDNLPSDPADASDIAASFASLNTKVDTIDDFLDTEIAAIKAKTDNLPSDPADASDIASSFTTVNTKLDTIDDFLDTEVAAIKAKTDLIPAAPATADLVLDEDIEGAVTLRHTMRRLLAWISGETNGGDTTTINFRDQADTKNRITYTVDADGNRSAVATDDT